MSPPHVPRRHRLRLTHTGRLAGVAFAGALPALIAAGWLLWRHAEPTVAISAVVVLTVAALLAASAVARRAAWPLRTLANLLGGLREGDYSMRVRGGGGDDALGELSAEANALATALREQRLSALEATSLLRAVMAEIDVAILVFDAAGRLRLANRAAEHLLATPLERLQGSTAGELGLADCLAGNAAQTLERSFPGGSGRFGVRRTTVREGGEPHQLLVVANLSSALREEERSAWQRLIRVLGHELNNSLAPIKSIAGSLRRRIPQAAPTVPGDSDDPTASPSPRALSADAEDRADLLRGLTVIEQRADALARFLEGYRRLARLPTPRRQPVVLGELVASVATLEKRVPVHVAGGPGLTLAADADQLQQLLINLVANSAEALLANISGLAKRPADTGVEADTPGMSGEAAQRTASAATPANLEIHISWWRDGDELELAVRDHGPGLANPTNLFVPFFTTKPGGSGIGLVLCRAIAEGHGGSLRLEPANADGSGCVARLRLPLTR